MVYQLGYCKTGAGSQTGQSTCVLCEVCDRWHRPPAADAPLLGLEMIEMARTTMDSAGLTLMHQWGVMLPTSARVALPTYLPLVATRYVELVRWVKDLQAYQIGSKATGGVEHLPHGFMTLLWDRTQSDDGDTFTTVKLQTEAVAAAVLQQYDLAKCMSEKLMIMFNNEDDLEVFDRALFRQNLQYLQTGTTASAAGGTCGVSIIIQRQGNLRIPFWRIQPLFCEITVSRRV